jgi:hypothetical protein
MDGRAIIEVLGVLVVAFVAFVLVPLFFTFLFVKYRGGSEEIYETAAALRSGKLADLLPWDSASLSELTREWVGSSTYTVSMFGRHDQGAGRVPSTRASTGWLLAFSMEGKNTGTDGQVLAMTSAHRLDLRITGKVCHASLDGAALGTLKLTEGGIFAPDGTALGSVRGGQLVLRDRNVAAIEPRTTSASERVPSPTPLVTGLLAQRTPEDEAWTLVVAVLQLAWAGPGVG